MENQNFSSHGNFLTNQRRFNVLWILLAGIAVALAAVFTFHMETSKVFAVGIVILVAFLYIYTHPKQSSPVVQTHHSDLRTVDNSGPEVDPAFLRSNGCH